MQEMLEKMKVIDDIKLKHAKYIQNYNQEMIVLQDQLELFKRSSIVIFSHTKIQLI